MKKLISVAILFVMVMTFATTMVSAVTTATLADELYAIGAKYGVSKAIIERTIKEVGVTDGQTDEILVKANQAVSVMEQAGVTNVSQLSQADRDRLVSIANEAANIVGADVSFKNGKVTISKDGKTLEVISLSSNGTLAYTGNNVSTVLVVSSIAVLALATVFVARRKMANA